MLDAMPADTQSERRYRALVALTLLSGARDRAIVSFKLKHVSIESELIEQAACEVRTKRAKTLGASKVLMRHITAEPKCATVVRQSSLEF